MDKLPEYIHYLIIKICLISVCLFGCVLSGCLNTEGILELRGNVYDEKTIERIPGRDIIVQGLLKYNDKSIAIDAGQFSTDSSGNFTFKLNKIKDSRYYNFYLVGDSDYFFKTVELGLYELEQKAKYLTFSLSKLTDLTISIQKISKTPFIDTLYLSLESNGEGFRTLFPYEIDNKSLTDTSSGYIPGLGLRWIGDSIRSVVKTRVFADKVTKISWELVRNKKREEFNDTLTCKRDLKHNLYFTY